LDLVDLVVEKRDAILATCARYGASDVRVFGSVVHDDYGPDSDIDFLVKLDRSDLQGFDYFAKICDLQDELEELLGVEVDVVDELGCKVRARVLKEAVAL
jgi:predicted nucleotidyltransferase